MTARRITLALVGAALVLGACGDDDNDNDGDIGQDVSTDQTDGMGVDAGIDAMPRQVISENVPLVVNEIVEAILIGGPGDVAHITMTAGGAPIDWNIHGHANGGTQVVNEELRVPNVDFVFRPTAQADWYVLIRNKGQTDIMVDLDIELYGDMEWTGWQ